MECEDIAIFFFLHSAKPSLLFKQLLSFLYRHNSNNHFYFSFVIPQCVQCCLSPRIAEMAFLPFLSPLCLGQLFFLKISFLFVGELVFFFFFDERQCLLPTVRLPASIVPQYPTLITAALSCATGPPKSLRQPFWPNKPTWFRLLSFQQYGIGSHFPQIIWVTNLSQACTVPTICS